MKTKTIPFDIELAKKIQAGEIEGKIMTKHGENARVICWDRLDKTHPIIALVHNKKGGIEESVYYTNEGKVFEDKYNLENYADLHIEVPDNKSQESQFKPFDKVLVRETNHDTWKARLYDYYGGSWYFCQDGHGYNQCIRFEGHEYLAGTSIKPKPTNAD